MLSLALCMSLSESFLVPLGYNRLVPAITMPHPEARDLSAMFYTCLERKHFLINM